MSYPGSEKLKIGHSLNPTTRAADIGGTLAPETPLLEAYYWCSERREDVERKAHEIERESRHNGEWFALSVEGAMSVIEKAAKTVDVEIQLVHENANRKPTLKDMTKEDRWKWLAQRRK